MNQRQYIELVNEAKEHSYRYYVLSQPTISDAEFDAIVDRISEAETEHPEWTLADSPTQCVGSDVEATTGKRLVRHRTRMLSCQKAQTTEAVTKWMNTTEKKLKGKRIQYALEWKMDGVSCSLVYQDGTLISAASRGNKGLMGQDWLQHARCIPSVPKTIAMKGRVEVRGEIVCPKSALAGLGYKDCRTAAASLMNQAWPSDDCADLVFIAWQMDADCGIGTESVSMIMANELGFIGEVRTCSGSEVVGLLEQFDDEREALAYPTDGVVVKIDDKALAASLGYTDHHPKGSIAFKFCAQKAVTRCLRVEISVGETGRRTPVAYLEPVVIMGRTVTSASLGSERKQQELGVVAGCMVEVGLSNDVTPKIYRVVGAEQNDAVYNEPEKSVAADAESENDISIIICNATTEATVDLNSDTEVCEPECSENVPLEDTDTEALGNDSVADVNLKPLALENLTEAEAGAQREAREDEIPASRLRPSRPTREDIQQQRRMTWAERQEREAQEAEDEERRQQRRKVLAAVGATIATLVLVNYFGLIGPALFGLVAGGLIKG